MATSDFSTPTPSQPPKDYFKEAPKEDDFYSKVRGMIRGSKRDVYGHPLDNFQNSADILRALVRARYGVDIEFTPDFIGLMMAVAIKGAREAHRSGEDNILDGMGYFATIQEIRIRQDQETASLVQTMEAQSVGKSEDTFAGIGTRAVGSSESRSGSIPRRRDR